MMTPLTGTFPNETYHDFTTLEDITQVGARTYRFLHREPGAELVMENVTWRPSFSEDAGFSTRLRLAWAMLTNKPFTAAGDMAILMDRATAIKVNDELIEALYYDENGTYYNGAPPASPSRDE